MEKHQNGEGLRVYAIHKDLPGHPGTFAVVGQTAYPDGHVIIDPGITLCGDLISARDYCEALGLFKLARAMDDHPTIVETWI